MQLMTDRKTIKPSAEIFDRLDELKRSGETWDGFFERAAIALEATDETTDRVPVCTNCGNKANQYTVEDGNLVCTLCAKNDLR